MTSRFDLILSLWALPHLKIKFTLFYKMIINNLKKLLKTGQNETYFHNLVPKEKRALKGQL